MVGDTSDPAVQAHESVHAQQFARGAGGESHASESALEAEAAALTTRAATIPS